MSKNFFIYMLLCHNNAYYTGYTNNIARRFKAHLTGTSQSKFTRSFKPLKVAQCWRVEKKSDALKIECFIKKLSRAQKKMLVAQPEILLPYFNDINIHIIPAPLLA